MEKQRSTEYRAAPDARQEDQVVAGRNPVIELLRSGRPVDKILIVRQQEGGGSLGRIVAMAKQAGIPVKDAAREKLDALCPGINHQGVAAFAAACSYCEVEELLARAGEEPPFLVIADGIEDPAQSRGDHPLGRRGRRSWDDHSPPRRCRTDRRGDEGFRRGRAASAGGAGGKPRLHSAGAAKEKHLGLCCGYGRRGLVHRRLRGRVALVIGSEGSGVSRLLRERSDRIVSLPMYGRVNSLNASVAAGILLYEVARQRRGIKAR